MSLPDVLADVLAIKGVRSASVVSRDGVVVDGVSDEEQDLEFVAGLVASSLASSQALVETLGESELEQAMIEFETGPVLLVPLAGPADGHVVMVSMADTGDLGRVRFQVRQRLAAIADAVAGAAPGSAPS